MTTDTLGQFKFTLTLTAEAPNTDNYTVYIDCGSYSAKLIVYASSTGAYDIVQTKVPTAPISTDDATQGSDLSDYLWVQMRDVNDNVVMPYAMLNGGGFLQNQLLLPIRVQMHPVQLSLQVTMINLLKIMYLLCLSQLLPNWKMKMFG